jgi:RNA polymerase sigma-70 factor (ECF subfamily)
MDCWRAAANRIGEATLSDDTKPLTELLAAWRSGDSNAADQLFPVVYDQLRTMAARHLRHERSDHTLPATALVNEVYLRLAGATANWQDRAHFFAIAATMMRRILVDHAKQHHRRKRGGDAVKISLDEAVYISAEPDPRILAIDEALDKLAAIDARKARLIELLFFVGLSHDESAQVLGISAATLHRDLKFAKAWIVRQISAGTNTSCGP